MRMKLVFQAVLKVTKHFWMEHVTVYSYIELLCLVGFNLYRVSLSTAVVLLSSLSAVCSKYNLVQHKAACVNFSPVKISISNIQFPPLICGLYWKIDAFVNNLVCVFNAFQSSFSLCLLLPNIPPPPPPPLPILEVCGKCGEALSRTQPAVRAMDKLFHSNCFCCMTCHRPLQGMQFYDRDGSPQCEDCYMVRRHRQSNTDHLWVVRFVNFTYVVPNTHEVWGNYMERPKENSLSTLIQLTILHMKKLRF